MTRALSSLFLFAVIVTSKSAAESPTVEIPAAFEGVFQSIAGDMRTPGGLRNVGQPEDLTPLQGVSRNEADDIGDPERRCEPIGPFRMMAREGVKIELVQAPALGTLMVLFEDVARGYFRTIHFKPDNRTVPEPTWQGYSTGRIDGSTLIVETTGLNEKTWLDSNGTLHSDKLRLVEQIRPIDRGQYLEYRITADDPQVLAKPHTYIRYFERSAGEIGEHVCTV